MPASRIERKLRGCLTDGWMPFTLSVNILEVSPRLHELLHICGCAFSILLAFLSDDSLKHGIDIFRHSIGISTNVNIGPTLKPMIDRTPVFVEAMLNINFLRRERMPYQAAPIVRTVAKLRVRLGR